MFCWIEFDLEGFRMHGYTVSWFWRARHCIRIEVTTFTRSSALHSPLISEPWMCWWSFWFALIVGGSAQVLAVARPNWTPTEKPADAEIPKPVTLIHNVRQPKKPERDVQAEQADWIKRYMAQQAEVHSWHSMIKLTLEYYQLSLLNEMRILNDLQVCLLWTLWYWHFRKTAMMMKERAMMTLAGR